MNPAPTAVLLLVLCVPATALPPGTTVAFAETPSTQWNAPTDDYAEGITMGGGYLYLATNKMLQLHSTGGGSGCSINFGGNGNGGPTYRDGIVHLPRTTGSGSTATSSILHYAMPFCESRGSTAMGAGIIEAVTWHRGHYYGVWRAGDSGDAYVRQYDTDWNHVHSWLLGNYGSAPYTGPHGIAFYGNILLLTRNPAFGDDFGIQHWMFQANGTLEHVGTSLYPKWTNTAIERFEAGSGGLHVVDDYDGGAATPYAWVAGRDASTGGGGPWGNSGIARFDLQVSLGTPAWTTPPVAPTGTPQVVVDVDNADPEGIAVDATHVYVLYATAIEKWTHAGDFVTSRDVSADFPDIHLGGGTIHNGYLYVETTNAPSLPRAASILQYDLTDLSLTASRATYDGYGEGGGIGVHDGRLYLVKNKGLSGELYVQRYDPATLDFVDESRIGHHHEFSLQGADFVNHGSTVYLYAPHDTPGDPYTSPGIHLWRSDTNGATWTYHGAAAYWTWLNPGDANREEAATQDLEFGCLNDVPYVWSVGRDAMDGGGAGSWTRHAVTDPDGFLNCINPPTASVTISPNVHAANGAAAGTEWAFPASPPGTTNVLSQTYLKAENTGTASGTLRVILGNFTRVDGGTIGLAQNLVYRYATGASPADVTTWNTVGGGADGTGYIPLPEGATTWVQYRITELPRVLPDGSYAASLSITDES